MNEINTTNKLPYAEISSILFFKNKIEKTEFLFEETIETSVDDVKKPDFPFMILLAAILKDILDVASIGFLGFFTNIILGLVIFFWILGKSSFLRKRMTRWFIRRYVATFIVESVPFINFLPITTILILLTYNREKKIVQLFHKELERLYKFR